MGIIDFNSFMAFCKGLEGQNLLTAGKKASFSLESVGNESLTYVPTSSGVPRYQKRRWIESVLNHYHLTKSLLPGDYRDITRNASYIVALIKLYLER